MRILQTGFELQDISNEFVTTAIGSVGSPTISITTTSPRSPGLASLHIDISGSTSGSCTAYGLKSLNTHPAEFFIRFAIKPGTYSGSTNQVDVVTFWEGGQKQVEISLTGTGNIALYRGTALLVTIGSVTSNVWNLVEAHFVINNTTGTAEGRVNSGAIGTFTGNTRSTSNNLVDQVSIGHSGSSNTTTHTQTSYDIDDFVINDTSGSFNTSWPGDGGIILLAPNGAGSVTNLSRGGTDSGANWSQVDDVPQNGTVDTVFANAAGSADLYTMTDTSLSTFSLVNAIRWVSIAKQDAAGAGSIARYIKSNGTIYEGSAHQLTTSGTVFSEISEIIESNPSTSLAFTIADINGLEAGLMTR